MIQKLLSASSTPPRHNTHPAGTYRSTCGPIQGVSTVATMAGHQERNRMSQRHSDNYGNRYPSSIGSNLMPVSLALVTAQTRREENTTCEVSLNKKRSSSGMFSSRRCNRSM